MEQPSSLSYAGNRKIEWKGWKNENAVADVVDRSRVEVFA